MRILAAEQSSIEASSVVADDEEIISSTAWLETRSRSQQFFEQVDSALNKANMSFDEVDAFAAGVGPGSFNALRMCISAMKAFALPSKRKVYAVGSAQALALKLVQAHGAQKISIIGDARRGHLWIASFIFSKSVLPERSDFLVVTPEKAPAAVDGSEMIASPDFARIEKVLYSLPESTTRLLDNPVYPEATHIALTAHAMIANSLEPGELAPIYVHPPV